MFAAPESGQLVWQIPASLVPSKLDADLKIVDDFLLDPVDPQNGKSASELLRKQRKKPVRRKRKIASEDEMEIGEDGEVVLKVKEKKKRQAKRKEEEQAYKSAQFVRARLLSGALVNLLLTLAPARTDHGFGRRRRRGSRRRVLRSRGCRASLPYAVPPCALVLTALLALLIAPGEAQRRPDLDRSRRRLEEEEDQRQGGCSGLLEARVFARWFARLVAAASSKEARRARRQEEAGAATHGQVER